MRLSVVLAAGLALVCAARADTIVLKNGRKIIAAQVSEADGKITYQTPAGEMSIPQSIVDHVDKDDFLYTSAASDAKTASTHIEPIPPVAGYEQIAAEILHNGSIDYARLADLDQAARSGEASDKNKDAAAHHVAAQYLLAEGAADSALSQYREALVYSPNNTGLLLNLAVIYLRQSQFNSAVDALESARRLAPENPDVAKLEGWAYYGANKLDQAVAAWQVAQKLRPEPDVAEALAKAERDKSEEEGYREGETAHFALKYSGAATPDLAEQILAALEQDFSEIESALDYTPPEQIGVILYTNQAFGDITRAPGWVGALNDGRLRIPVQGLSSMTPDLARVLRHELTHSFIGQKTHYRAPTWLQEGVAQYMEGQRSARYASALISLAGQNQIPALKSMEGSWLNLSGDSAALAYAWSLATSESIISAGGWSDVSRLLEAIAAVPDSETALRSTLGDSYADLNAQTVRYLEHAYGR